MSDIKHVAFVVHQAIIPAAVLNSRRETARASITTGMRETRLAITQQYII